MYKFFLEKFQLQYYKMRIFILICTANLFLFDSWIFFAISLLMNLILTYHLLNATCLLYKNDLFLSFPYDLNILECLMQV